MKRGYVRAIQNLLRAGELATRKITPAYDGRNASRRLSGASAFAHAAAGGPVSRGRLSSSSAHGSRVAVCVFAWMAGKFVS